MKTIIKSLALALIIVLVSGCLGKHQFEVSGKDRTYAMVEIYKPEGLNNALANNVYVLDFKRDSVDFADSLHYELSNLYINGDRYFNTQRRDDLAIVHEYAGHKLGFLGYKTEDIYYISGEIIKADYDQFETFDERVDYDQCLKYSLQDGKCVLYSTYRQSCDVVRYKLGLNVKVRLLSNSNIVFDRYYEKSKEVRECGDKKSMAYAPDLDENLAILSKKIATEVVKDFTPQKASISIPFVKNEDIKYTQKEKNLLRNSLKMYVKSKEDSLILFKELIESTNEISSTALYNYALVNESLNKDKKSLEFYKKALIVASRQRDINLEIIDSIKRVESKIEYKGARR